MTFRTKLLLISSFTVAGAVASVTGAVLVASRRAFEHIGNQRRVALLEQFQQEMKTQGLQVSAAVDRAAQSQTVTRIAAESERHDPDLASFYNNAQDLAETAGLPFLDITKNDLTILSSAHWPVRFGYKNDWANCAGCTSAQPFLTKISLPDGTIAVSLAAMRRTSGVTVVGARRLDAAFLKNLGEAPGMRALLWVSPQQNITATQDTANTPEIEHFAENALAGNQFSARIADEAFLALPLKQNGQTVALLVAASSLAEEKTLERSILSIGIWVAAVGILLGVLLGVWTTERITRPVMELARGARAVAAGDWSARVSVRSNDEIGELATAFNGMTVQLIEQRERALQAERVAAWRELARRLAHELKNPLFPLQITIENMQRARAAGPQQFEEVFHESTATLLDEVRNFKTIIGRFSDFAKMPAPHFEPVNVNEILSAVLKLYEAQLASTNIILETSLAPACPLIDADPDQLRRCFVNLTLNAVDAMPAGGNLSVTTSHLEPAVQIEIADSGQGLTEEESSRLFTPYYTTKQHGTGLGLAIVQGVVSDHHGKISVSSKQGRGTAFIIELPLLQPEAGATL